MYEAGQSAGPSHSFAFLNFMAFHMLAAAVELRLDFQHSSQIRPSDFATLGARFLDILPLRCVVRSREVGEWVEGVVVFVSKNQSVVVGGRKSLLHNNLSGC